MPSVNSKKTLDALQDGITDLMVSGRRLRGLADLSRFRGLELLVLRNLVEVDLAVVAGLPRLRQLIIEGTYEGVRSAEVITECTSLEIVQLRANAVLLDALAQVAWHRLPRLSLLVVEGRGAGPYTPWMLDPVPTLKGGVKFANGPDIGANAKRTLGERAHVLVLPTAAFPDLRAAITQTADDTYPWSLTADLVPWVRDAESNHDVEQMLLKRLKRQAVDAVTAFDSDADWVLVYGRDREALEALADRITDALTP